MALFSTDITLKRILTSNNIYREDNGDAENVSMNSQAGDSQARKAAAQAVIELTDRLAAAEEEAAALRRKLKNTRSLTKVTCSDGLRATQGS